MAGEIEEAQAETRKLSTLRIVAKRQGGKEPYTAKIPVKGDTFSLVLPSGYVNWPDGKPYPDSINARKTTLQPNFWPRASRIPTG